MLFKIICFMCRLFICPVRVEKAGYTALSKRRESGCNE